MKITNFNKDWKFWEDKDSFALVWNVPENAQDIDLPHDAMLINPAHEKSLNGGNTGFRDGGSYTYVKLLDLSKTSKDKRLILKFEGIYMNAFVYVNGQLAGKCNFGYTTFYVPINNFVKYDEINEIRVKVYNNGLLNSRWYSGSGIYRDVYLLESSLLHIAQEGVRVTTEDASSDFAILSIETEVKNENNVNENFVLKTKVEDKNQNVVAEETLKLTLFGSETRNIKSRVAVKNPKLWSDEVPELYTVKTEIIQEDKVIDSNEDKFGIRTLTVDALRGLRVNGKEVKLRGACIHHDSGLLGAATHKDAQFRQVKKLKEAGFNAIRMAHNPIAPAMLKACDELGVYVMEEAFDMWSRPKGDNDYGLFFEENWQKDIEAIVKKDYNHPSVILYSIGNEIPEIATDYGVQLAQKLSDKIKSLDKTRFTLASINGVFASGDAVGKIISDIAAELNKAGNTDGNVNDFMTIMDKHLDKIVVHEEVSKRLEKAEAATDILGYNYMTARYEGDKIKYPNRVIVGSETYPPEISRNWGIISNSTHVIGDFTWTGWDYLGEAGVGVPAYEWGEGGFGAKFPCQIAFVGDIDITGYRRPMSYYREIVFGLRKNPYITVQNPAKYGKHLIKTPWVMSDTISSWSWDKYEEQDVIVEVYSAGDEVELFVNDKLVDRKKVEKNVALFDTKITSGEVKAISYENNVKIGESILKSADKDTILNVKVEENSNDTKDLVFIEVELTDKNGIVKVDEKSKLKVEVEDGVEILAFGSANPKPLYNFNENITETFLGRAQLILKNKENLKEIEVKLIDCDTEKENVYKLKI